MITISLNSQVITFNHEVTLRDVLHANGYSEACFAVAINRQFIPRAQYANTYIQHNDQIDIVTPMQGG